MADSNRWILHKFDALENKIVILDKLSKRERSYHVPNSTHAILKENALYVTTSTNNKVMKICLHNGSRKILSIEDTK
jgi:hypothetical protein